MSRIQPAKVSEPFNQRESEILSLITAGQSNLEIAHSLFISLDTVKWYNQRIFGKLGVSSRTQAIQKAREIRLIDDPWLLPSKSTASPKHNLPAPVDSFVGRMDEISRLQNLFYTHRLVTLAGPGGVGKTRLAIQVGWALKGAFRDGIFLVNLAAIQEPSLVLNAIATALRLYEVPGHPVADLLQEYLAEKDLLLILDNFEQVLEAGPQVHRLLAAAPCLKVLVTSREILHISGEQIFTLQPLLLDPLPGPGGLLSEAVQLFGQRAQAVKDDFHLTAENTSAVLEICRRVDGLPLGIELAAARVRFSPPQTILAQLDKRLSVLVGGGHNLPHRQKSLRASIEWSYDLLTPAEQTLLRRLAVFAGGCMLEAAEAICAGSELDVLAGIESLLDKHLLLVKEVDGEPRFGMFETIREFGLERLEQSAESMAVHQRCAEYYTGFFMRFFHQINRLDREIENLRSVLRWSIKVDQIDQGLQIANNGYYWSQRNSEWRFWLEELLSAPGAQAASHSRFGGVWHAAMQAEFQGDYGRCQDLLGELVTLARALDYKLGQWVVFAQTGTLLIVRQDYTGAIEAFTQALQVSERYLETMWVGLSNFVLGGGLLLVPDYDRAEVTLKAALQILTDTGNLVPRIDTLTSLGYTYLEKQDVQSAWKFLTQSLQESIALGHKAGYADCLNGLAAIAQQQCDWIKAARLYSAVQSLASTAGLLSRVLPLKILSQRFQADLRRQLDPAALERAWREGQAMSLDEALQGGLEIEVV